jgi:hypothetical protein
MHVLPLGEQHLGDGAVDAAADGHRVVSLHGADAGEEDRYVAGLRDGDRDLRRPGYGAGGWGCRRHEREGRDAQSLCVDRHGAEHGCYTDAENDQQSEA